MELSPIENRAGSVVPREHVFADTELRKELEKILASESFRKAEGLKRFLRFSVEHTLLGEGGQVEGIQAGGRCVLHDAVSTTTHTSLALATLKHRTRLRDHFGSCVAYQFAGRDSGFIFHCPSREEL